MTGLLLIGVAHGVDLVTLLAVAEAHGIAGEYNPLAVALYAAGGSLALVGLKVAGIGGFVLVVRRSRLRLSLAVVAGLTGALVNAISWSLLA